MKFSQSNEQLDRLLDALQDIIEHFDRLRDSRVYGRPVCANQEFAVAASSACATAAQCISGVEWDPDEEPYVPDSFLLS